jgi:drug/metabolite transporter (DMT)-like permease
MHTTSGRWRLGLCLTLVTTTMWTILPLGLKILLEVMDPVTITWYRFVMSALLFWLLLWRSGKLPSLRGLQRNVIGLLAISGIGLYSNYLLFLFGLDRVSPGAAQILIQSGPMFLLLGSLIIFREPFSRIQWLGFVLLIGGMFLFFNRQLDELFGSFGEYSAGAVMILLAAILWAAYSLAQKQLHHSFTSAQMLGLLSAGAALVYLPAASPAKILLLTNFQLVILVLCGLNLVLAYSAFTEALRHWEASRISAVLSTIPLLTLGLLEICERWFPSFGQSEDLNTLGWTGAVLVVIGSMQCALARKQNG